jgi:hypothetical protein
MRLLHIAGVGDNILNGKGKELLARFEVTQLGVVSGYV